MHFDVMLEISSFIFNVFSHILGRSRPVNCFTAVHGKMLFELHGFLAAVPLEASWKSQCHIASLVSSPHNGPCRRESIQTQLSSSLTGIFVASGPYELKAWLTTGERKNECNDNKNAVSPALPGH